MWEQYLTLLNSLEEGEAKTNLITGFGKLQEDNSNAIASRDKAKGDLAPMKDLIASLGSVTGLGEEMTADAVKSLLSSKSKGGEEVQSLNATLAELRGKYTDLEGTHNDFVKSSNDKAFELALSQSDIFKDVSSDPFLRNAVMGTIKPKLVLGEDGSIYARGNDGKVMTDLVTDKPITGTSLFAQMVDSGQISKAAINGTVGNGTGGEGNKGGKGHELNGNMGGNKAERTTAIQAMLDKG